MEQEIVSYLNNKIQTKKNIKAILFYINDSNVPLTLMVSETSLSGSKHRVYESFDDGEKLTIVDKIETVKTLLRNIVSKLLHANKDLKLPTIYFTSSHDSEEFEVIYEQEIKQNKNTKNFLEKFTPEWQQYLFDLKIKKEQDLEKITKVDIWEEASINTIIDCSLLPKLNTLEIASNKIKDLNNLKTLNQVSSISLIRIKNDEWELPVSDNLKTLWIRNIKLNESIVKKVLQLQSNLIELGLTGCELTEFPAWVLDFKNLKYLNLSHNLITSWPEDLLSLPNLKTIWVGMNETSFETIADKFKERWNGVKIMKAKSDQP